MPWATLASACTQMALAPHSQWKVEARNGVVWLLTPCGDRFFSIGINVMDGGLPTRMLEGRLGYHWGTFYPDLDAWGQLTRTRVLDWNFNTAGAWSLHPTMLGLPVIPDLNLGRMAQFHWFDPLHPSAEERMRAWARRLVAPYKGNPYRIGYFSDNEVGWWNGALFTYFLKQPATNHTKQKLVARLRDHYGNDWGRFSRDFVPPPGVSSFDALLHRNGVIAHLRPGGEGIQVVRRWTGIVAELYYRLVHLALREADPEALIFADRLQIYYDPAAVRAMAPYVDAIATNYDVDSPDGWIARYYFDGLRRLTGNKPILISEWFFAAHENRTGNRNNGHLMTVQTQAERARGAVAAAQRFAQDPHIVGMHWFQYYDHPVGGRADGEDYNFGLVDIHDHPYTELIEAFSRVNARLAEIHQNAWLSLAPPAGVQPEIPEADIDPGDRSLAEWPKEQALVVGLVAPPPEIVFGDFYLAWNRTGLSLATISMDYYDPGLLAYGDEFPLEEAFRIEWGVDAGAGPRRFALYLIPAKVPPQPGAAMMRIRLCRTDSAPCDPVSSARATSFGSENPRITAEVSLPWNALGVDGPPPDRQLRMELAATAWHRARWMSWSGLPPAAGMQDPTTWAVVRLGKRSQPPQP
ncbi:MAG: hypothetical protein HYZ81_09285 [Nitrospinae bacterium]|nr:hypothetical protein [Nitrospinota bacterium]